MAYTPSYEIELNRDPNTGEPILLYISNESHVVYDTQVVLGQIPSETAQSRVQITDMTEIALQELISSSTQFKVDYNNGVVYFHSSKENSTVNISYYGRGMKRIYDDRMVVRSKNDKLNNVLTDLDTRLNNVVAQVANPIDWQQGEWSSEITYAQNAGVVYNGSSYVSLQDNNLNHSLSDTLWWLQIAGKGDTVASISDKTRVFTSNSSNSYNDEFNDGSLDVAWQKIDVTNYKINWFEPTNVKGLSAYVPSGAGAMKARGILKPFTGLSAPFYIETAVRIMSRSFNYPAVGLCFSDSTTVGLGTQVIGMIGESGNVIISNWTGFNARTSKNEVALHNGAQLDCVYLRLVYVSANTFQLLVSLDGIVWIDVNGQRTYTLTPTYFGLITSTQENSTYPIAVQYLYFRVGTGLSING